MISSFFRSLFYIPLYNGLILILSLVPNGDVGVAIVIFTVIVKLILFPLTKKSLIAQRRMKEIEPDLKSIREKFKNDREAQARATMELYREKKINPFSGIVAIIIQIPIIIALYRVFLVGGWPSIDTSLLYSFIHGPASVSMNFLGLLDVSKRSIILAILAGVTQFFQAKYALPPQPEKKTEDKNPSFQESFMKTMNLQMRYFLPIFIFFISWSVSGAVALYWVTNNIFSIGQELYMRRKSGK